MNLQAMAALIGGTVKGDPSIEIQDIRNVEDAGEGHITFLTHKKYEDLFKKSKASAVIVGREIETGKPQIIHPNPKLAFARLMAEFHPLKKPEPKIDSRADMGENVNLGKDVTISAFVSLGKNVTIGDDSVLHPGVIIGDNCRVGGHTTIHPNVTLYPHTVIGDHVVLHAGAVIGADGFGYTPDEQGQHFKINQIGCVVIEDYVEVGANTCIDRATMGTTLVKRGTKIDNLVQIAHNCTIGEHSILVSQVGLAGSCTLGHHVVLAGQVGLADHVTLGDQVTLTAQSGTFRDIESNSVYGGSPSIPLTIWKKYITALPKLPDLIRKVKDLANRLNAIEKKRGED